MYYEERVISNTLCCRYTPDGDFRPLSPVTLTKRLLEAERRLAELKLELIGNTKALNEDIS